MLRESLAEPSSEAALSPEEPITQDGASNAADRSRWRGWLMLAVALMPALVAVWASPAFVTQDGPAHLYNAHILVESLRANAPFRDVFVVRWSPLPNWLGHLMQMAMVAAMPPIAADRLATTVPLVGLAASTFWLKRRVRGRRGDLGASLFATIVAMNVCWLFGFTSFLLGACLFPLTLGVWWAGRDGFGPRRAAVLAGLVVVGYFAHVVSMGLTVVGLVVLTLATPGSRRRSRTRWTMASLTPLVVLLPMYRNLMGRGGPLEPAWGQWRSLVSLDSWREQLGWVDPISLGRKGALPFVAWESSWWGFATPAVLMSAAILVLLVARAAGRAASRPGDRAWLALAAFLILGGFFSPDTLGESHGNYLPQRVVLLGLVALAACLDIDASRRSGKIALALLAAAFAIQATAVFDYARESSARVAPFLRARAVVGRDRRIGTLLIDTKRRFRANPLLHADNLLGVGTGNVVWSNYETRYYYFPVQFRENLDRPASETFEEVATMIDPKDAAERKQLWSRLLRRHASSIDVLLIWGHDQPLEDESLRLFGPRPRPIIDDGPLRAWSRR
jgi:hypothetical protein